MYKILTLNKISHFGTDRFSDAYTCSDSVESPTGIMVRSASMHDMELSPDTLAIARAGAGTNNIPLDKCAEQGVVVFNTPGANSNAVKELVICGLLLASRKIAAGYEWSKTLKGKGDEVGKLVEKGKSSFAGPEIAGKTLGVIGLGAIGFKVAQAAEALGMKIVGYDPFLSEGVKAALSDTTVIVTDIKELFAKSDYITIHVPLNDATKDTVSDETLAICKDGVRILNFARGGLVNNDAIKNALASGKAAAYVTDFPSDDIIGVDGVITIPHLGASTPESEDNCAMMAADELIGYIEKGEIINSVNMPRMALAELSGKRVCVIHKTEAADAVRAALGADVKYAERGAYGYTVADCDADAGEIARIDGVIRVRVLG
ncbi:MAG: 3-phosphoglycerate dehydrogenase [Clostridia bacterium]|nr:3-phosphoglycerate dehydrogenase [Clostridia bacterium]